MKNLTIEQLAKEFGQTVWVKGDLKRIYLNEGYNTRKMTTKTFIYEKDGEFFVKCTIDCPAQNEQWIEKQEELIKEKVYAEIKSFLNAEEDKKPKAPAFQEGGVNYSHPKFGIGVVTAEDDNTITLLFEGIGEKKMVKKFTPLTKVA
jgi:hypothetical protein